jgi:hypothetical protein
MNENKKRRLAAFFSLVVAAGNFGIIVIVVNVGTFKVFLEIFSTTTQLIIVVLTGIFSLVVGVVLLTKIELGKKTILTTLIISSIIFVVAAVQMSVELGFVLFWPWSLYKLYRSEIA